MCNLAAWTGKPEKREHIEQLLTLLMGEANKDASGMALHCGSKISTFKAPGPATNLLGKEKWKAWYAEREESIQAGLLHARLATHGRPEDNRNNHPHISELGSALVHKGVVHPKVHYTAKSVCDSEQLLHALDDKGFVEGMLSCPGWASVAYFSGDDPGMLWLFSNANPLYVVEYSAGKVIASLPLPGGKPLPTDIWIGMPFEGGEVIWGPKVPSTPTRPYWLDLWSKSCSLILPSSTSAETEPTTAPWERTRWTLEDPD